MYMNGIDDRGVEDRIYGVVLQAVGSNKVLVMKVVRTFTQIELKQIQAFVEKAPFLLGGDLSLEEAEMMREELAAAGATVSVTPFSLANFLARKRP